MEALGDVVVDFGGLKGADFVERAGKRTEGGFGHPIPKYEDEKPQPLTPESILEIRKKAGLSQVKFAATLGVSVKKVSAWEHGKAVPDEAEAEKIRRME